MRMLPLHHQSLSLVISFCLSITFVASFAVSQVQATKSKKPNILLISIDDLNDWTSSLGGHPQAKTPNIDRLADRGTLFSNAHCQSPVCNPSRASMLTGRHPHTSGIYFLSPDLKQSPVLEELDTLPERFAKHGYQTMAAGKIFHTRDKRFFQEYGGNMGGFGPRPKEKISQPHGHPLWDWGAFPESDDLMPDFKIAQWASTKLKSISVESDKPFFMGVGFYRPHVPMFAPKKWFDLFPRNQIQLPLVNDKDRNDLSEYAIALTNENHVSPEHAWIKSAGQWEHAVQSYLASVAFADYCLGIVLDALDQSPHKDNTIVVLFADHGFHLGEKQRWAKRTIWEDGTRVPLIVVDNRYSPKQVTSKPAQLLDVFPTLLELANLPSDTLQEGKSLVPLMKDPQADWSHIALSSFGKGNFAVRSERYRFIQYLDGSEEFYDHANDPHEWYNLINKKKLTEVIEQHRKQLPANQADVLPGNSTGHKAYQAASRFVNE